MAWQGSTTHFTESFEVESPNKYSVKHFWQVPVWYEFITCYNPGLSQRAGVRRVKDH